MSAIDFNSIFYPKNIAVIGASNNLEKLGGRTFKLLLDFGFKGKVYAVNPNETSIFGHPCYRSVLDIPEPVERAIVVVPAKAVPAVIEECAQKGLKTVQILTSGFEEGQAKQALRQTVEKVKQKGLRIIGPNCMGTYSPAVNLSFTRNASLEEGEVAFISQSGGLTIDIVAQGKVMGLKFSKAISVGNCIDVEHADFLEYLAADPKTRIIGFYLEGVRDGRRFFELLKQITPQKPVVILKGGRSAQGAKSVASHTGNLAGQYEVWEAVFKQTGAIAVETVQEFMDVLLCLQCLEDFPAEKRLLLVGNGGGAAVLATDFGDKLGWQLQDFSPATKEKLKQLSLPAGSSSQNPIDIPANILKATQGRIFTDIMKTIFAGERFGAVIAHFNMLSFLNYVHGEQFLQDTVQAVLAGRSPKVPMVLVLRSNSDPAVEAARQRLQQYCVGKGLPVLGTIEGAIYALDKLAKYRQWVVSRLPADRLSAATA
ncbi:MAG: acetate---CoA ligase (ADP-forming) subunit alpha [Clostridia bacterium]|nr:acetate---CoA ligase (ADP-forming) subunit alpha [Clostridia bacterium]